MSLPPILGGWEPQSSTTDYDFQTPIRIVNESKDPAFPDLHENIDGHPHRNPVRLPLARPGSRPPRPSPRASPPRKRPRPRPPPLPATARKNPSRRLPPQRLFLLHQRPPQPRRNPRPDSPLPAPLPPPHGEPRRCHHRNRRRRIQKQSAAKIPRLPRRPRSRHPRSHPLQAGFAE